MTLDEKLGLFEGMLQGEDSVYVWQYDAQGNLLKSNCPDEAVLGAMFQVFGCKETMYLQAENRLDAMFACAKLYVLAVAGRKLSTA